MKKLLSLTLVILMLFSTVSINVSASTTPSDWAINEVNNAKNAGIITNAITRNYQKDITREEFCELVVKLYEKLTNQSATVGTDIFTDTDNQEILKAYNLGIVKGVSSNQFAPYNNITRQEICVMLTRCIDIAIDGSDITIFKTNSFADRNKIANWAVDSVDYAFDNSIIKGVGENKVDPLGNTTCEQAVLLAYRIFANRNNLVVFDNLEENDLRDLFSVKEKINTSVNEYTNSEGKININSLDTVINKVADVSKELKENNEILDYNKDENTVWLKLNSGLQFVYVPEIEGYDLGGNNISIMTYQPFNSDYGTERPGSGDMERGIEATDGSAQNISNKFGKYSFTQNYDDGQVTLDSLKQIGSNQIILWHGHGGYNSSIHSFLGIGEELDETKFLWDPVYYVKNIKYTGDYLSGRIVCLSSGNIGVTSKFFTKYLPQMSNTFVYLGTCESAHDSVLVDSFINKGATTVIGNSATIYTQYNQKMIKSTCDGLMMKNSNSQYNTILEAQNYAKSLHGNTDGSEYNATPVIYGNQSLRLSHEQSKYKLFEDKMTWQEAKSYCESIGGHLATITSSSEQKEIENLLSEKSLSFESYWLGATKNSGSWNWITKESFSYSNWDTNEPNGSSNDMVLQIYSPAKKDKKGIFKWDDTWNTGDRGGGIKSQGFICEFDGIEIPEEPKKEDKYIVVNKDMTWQEAKSYCENMGGYLATITSISEQTEIENLLSENSLSFESYWLGGYKSNNQWKWTTGESFSYSNWDTNEPNGSSNDMVLQIYSPTKKDKKGIFKWDDTWNTGDKGGGIKSQGFICEFD